MEQCVISVLGVHAGEGVDSIFSRKLMDIEHVGRTYWLIHARQARVQMVQELGQSVNRDSVKCYFIEGSSKKAARPTTTEDAARKFSQNGIDWKDFNTNVGPVTGKITNAATALVLSDIQFSDSYLNLWDFSIFGDPASAIKFSLGNSSVCAIRKDSSNLETRMRSNMRRVVAVATLTDPYAVYVSK